MIDKDNEKHSNNKRDFRYQVSLHYPDSGKEMLKTLLWASRVSYKESHACGITLQNCTHTDTHNSHVYPHTDTHILFLPHKSPTH